MRTARGSAKRSSRTVLLVDSDPGMIEVLEVNFARASFRVLSAQNGAQALALASEERPDLVLLEVDLPDLDGLDVCRRLKQSARTCHIPVILVSADVDSGGIVRGIAAGAEDYISKPCGPSEIVTVAEAHAARGSQRGGADALVRLPGYSQLRRRLSDLNEARRPFAMLYLYINLSEGVDGVLGAPHDQGMSRVLLEIVCDAVRLFGAPGDFVGHSGDGSLVIITVPERAEPLCRRILADFDSMIGRPEVAASQEAGEIEPGGTWPARPKRATASLSIAAVTNERRRIRSLAHADRIAAELREHLRRESRSAYCFDQRRGRATAGRDCATTGVPSSYRQDVRSLRRALSWVDLLSSSLEAPVGAIERGLSSLLGNTAGSLGEEQSRSLKSIEGALSRLAIVRKEIEGLQGIGRDVDEASLALADPKNVVDRANELAQASPGRSDVEVVVEEQHPVPHIIVDERSLTQAVFHSLRALIEASAPGDQVRVSLARGKGAFVVIRMVNRNYVIPSRELDDLFRAEPGNDADTIRRNDLHLAMVYTRGVGGELKVESRSGLGTSFLMSVPRRWRSCADQVSRMQSMVEVGGQEVRSHFEGLHKLLALSDGRLTDQFREGLGTLENKVRELEVLCNLSLLMAEDLGSDLEKQSGRVLDHDADDLFALEAVLAMAREMVSSSYGAELLDMGSTRRVARYALATAAELKMDKRARRTLYHAALLRDLDIILSLQKVLAQRKRALNGDAEHSGELATSVQDMLSRIKYLQPAMSMVSRRYERFDSSGNPRALGGADIPLGARILAVAEAFETLISPSSPAGVLAPEEALRSLAADSGGRFDPVVVAALLRALRGGVAGTGIEECGL